MSTVWLGQGDSLERVLVVLFFSYAMSLVSRFSDVFRKTVNILLIVFCEWFDGGCQRVLDS